MSTHFIISPIEKTVTLVTVAEQGPRGPDGKSAYALAVEQGFAGTEQAWLASLAYSGIGSSGYRHDQSTPSSSWIINHNFGRNVGPVSLYTVGGAAIIGDVVNIDLNQTLASFDTPIAGYAIVI